MIINLCLLWVGGFLIGYACGKSVITVENISMKTWVWRIE